MSQNDVNLFLNIPKVYCLCEQKCYLCIQIYNTLTKCKQIEIILFNI